MLSAAEAVRVRLMPLPPLHEMLRAALATPLLFYFFRVVLLSRLAFDCHFRRHMPPATPLCRCFAFDVDAAVSFAAAARH